MGKRYFEKMKFPCMKLFVGAGYIRIRPEYLDQSLLAKQKQEENHSAMQAPTVQGCLDDIATELSFDSQST